MYFFRVLFALSLLIGMLQGAELSLVPAPKSLQMGEGAGMSLKNSSRVACGDEAIRELAELALEPLRQRSGLALETVLGEQGALVLELDENLAINDEGYELRIGATGARLKAKTPRGIFYGLQTFQQLPSREGGWQLPLLEIRDEPAFPWRGVMLDVSRYFFNVDYVKRYLDMMAMHKLNVLHWHLVDDCGWRIEIKKYPRLTEVGAFRGEGEQGYGGFYTQEEVREVVAYAAQRGIEVVPEIEMPAHTLAALVAYPHLGCTGKPFKMPTRHSISPEIYCVGQESTWVFLEDVFAEVAALFPSQWVHIGGDEARYARWQKCEHCQKVIREKSLSNELELQGWASNRLADILAKHDKRILGWAEILEAGARPGTGLMVWNKPQQAYEGAKKGHPVIASFVRNTYFDTPESRLPGEPPAANWTPPVSLRMAYEWHPVPQGLSEAEQKLILGPNGCVWSDQFLHKAEILADKPGQGTAASEAYIDYLSLPRLAALAEVGWTPRERRDYADFLQRMKVQYLRYQDRGYHFRVPTPELNMRLESGLRVIKASAPVKGAQVHYTLDGSTPTAQSPRLSGELKVKPGRPVKLMTVLADGRTCSLVETVNRPDKRFAQLGDQIGEWKSGQPGVGEPVLVEFDATGRIDRNGEYLVTFQYTKGAQRLDIFGIEVLRNDMEVVARDEHQGFTGHRNSKNGYRIEIKDYQTGASFKIRAKIAGDTGDDSNGAVFIKRLK